MENLYTFSKNSWHVKLFKWIYGTNPTQTFKTMCPYFWSYVFTIVFLPLILIIKLFGKGGTKLLSQIESYKRDRENRLKIKFLQKSEIVVKSSDEDCYNFTRSSCWSKYSYYIDYYIKENINDKSRNYASLLKSQKLQRKEKVREFKENKYFKYIALGVSAITFIFIGYFLYKLISLIEFPSFSFKEFLVMFKTVTSIVIVLFVLFLIIKYLFPFIVNILNCIRLPKLKFIGRFFQFIGNGIKIFCSMIYATYKNYCPLITWKDDE